MIYDWKIAINKSFLNLNYITALYFDIVTMRALMSSDS